MKRLSATALAVFGLVAVVAPTQAALHDTEIVTPGLPEASALSVGTESVGSISADGCRIVFVTTNNLDPDDPPDMSRDLYVRDVCNPATILVDRDISGVKPASLGVGLPYQSISADGQHVSFTTTTVLDPGNDFNGIEDVYVRDLNSLTGTELVTEDFSNSNAVGGSQTAISSDGRYVAFTGSAAASMYETGVTDANAGGVDIFRRDTLLNTTKLVSEQDAVPGTTGNVGSQEPHISYDGNRVAFTSGATTLDPEDVDAFQDAFVHDVNAGSTELVSRASGVAGANSNAFAGGTSGVEISGDGNTVAFATTSTNLDIGGGANQIYARDLDTLTTAMVSRRHDGSPSSGVAINRPFSLSANGDIVGFTSADGNLTTSGGSNTVGNAYVRDRATGTTALVSRASGTNGSPDNEGNGSTPVANSQVSGNGFFVAFESHGSNLVPGDANGQYDVFRRQIGAPPPPPPVEGQSFNLTPIAGVPLVAQPGKGFVPLLSPSQFTNGSVIDVRTSVVEMTNNYNGTLETIQFYQGYFKVILKSGSKPIVELRLVGALGCGKNKAGASSTPIATAAAAGGRKLWGRGRGHYRTRGRRGAATVRGTTWLTQDRCNGTTKFKVAKEPGKHSIIVDDFGLPGKKNKIVNEGKSYTAR